MPLAFIEICKIGKLFFARHLDYTDNPDGTPDYYFIGWYINRVDYATDGYKEIVKF